MDLNEKNVKKIERAIGFLEQMAAKHKVDPSESELSYADGVSKGMAIGLGIATSHFRGLFGLEEEEE